MKTKRIFYYLLLLIIGCYQLNCQSNGCDSCGCEANRILSTFEKYKIRYINVLNDSIRIRLKRDSIYEKNHLKEGDINLEKFTYIINPLLKLNKKAEVYNDSINFCKYFDVDTLTYGCEAGLFVKDSMYFYCRLGDNDCYCIDRPFIFTMRYYHYFTDDSNVKYRMGIYKLEEVHFDKNIQMKFLVKGYPLQYFLLNKGQIIMRSDYKSDNDFIEDDKKSEENLRKLYRGKWTRTVANKCHSE
ncbi:MAG: hypothetical protein ABSG15_02815 [FCB group bacterium]|jgi:hypothetical protein